MHLKIHDICQYLASADEFIVYTSTEFLSGNLKIDINFKKIKSWIVTGRTDAEAEAPILCPSDSKNRPLGKDPDAGKDWRQEEKGTTEDEMVGWHHRLNGHEFEQALGAGDGQGSLVCCSTWDCKESDMTNWTGKIDSFTQSSPWSPENICSSYSIEPTTNFSMFSSHLFNKYWVLSASLVVKTPCFQCRGCRFNFWWGTKIPHAAWCSQK